MKKTVICRLDLGQTRVAGYTLYDPKSKEFQETTPKEVIQMIRTSGVNGLKLSDNDIILDKEGFNMENLKIKSAVGKYRNMFPCEHGDVKFYSVVRLIDKDEGRFYEVVDNKCARVKIDATRLIMLASFSLLAGVIICNGNVKLCNDIIYEDRRSELPNKDLDDLADCDEIVDIGGRLMKISELKRINTDETLDETIMCESANSPIDTDYSKLENSSVQQIDCNNKLIHENSVALKEAGNGVKQQLNQSEATTKKVLDAGLLDSHLEEESSETKDAEKDMPQTKYSVETEIDATVHDSDKNPSVGKKTAGKKTSGRVKTK